MNKDIPADVFIHFGKVRNIGDWLIPKQKVAAIFRTATFYLQVNNKEYAFIWRSPYLFFAASAVAHPAHH